jgi:hypothetical protein
MAGRDAEDAVLLLLEDVSEKGWESLADGMLAVQADVVGE